MDFFIILLLTLLISLILFLLKCSIQFIKNGGKLILLFDIMIDFPFHPREYFSSGTRGERLVYIHLREYFKKKQLFMAI